LNLLPSEAGGNFVPRAGEEPAGLFLDPKEFFDPQTQCYVARAGPGQVGGLFRYRQFQRSVENLDFVLRGLRHGQIRSFTRQCEKTAQKGQSELAELPQEPITPRYSNHKHSILPHFSPRVAKNG
jgi:hypothetical protein